MKAIALIFGLFCGLFIFGCAKKEPVLTPVFNPVITYKLDGSWRYYEEGYSPGAGYIINPIPATPLQKLTFSANGQLQKDGDRLTGSFALPYYRTDSTQYGKVVYFLKNLTDKLTYGMTFRIRNDTLRLMPFCYEGCHFGFVRIK